MLITSDFCLQAAAQVCIELPERLVFRISIEEIVAHCPPNGDVTISLDETVVVLPVGTPASEGCTGVVAVIPQRRSIAHGKISGESTRGIDPPYLRVYNSATMKPDQRQKRILDLLRVLQKELKVEELAERFGVSPLTIRRDLDVLAEDKTIIRTHGGCLAVGRAALETEYHKKVAKNFDLKQAIARSALNLIEESAVILLNDGSTTFHVGMQLGNRGMCTIYTNSLAMISEYSRFRAVRLFLLAGEYDENLYSIRGSLTEHVLESLYFDRIFLGTDAIDANGRCLVRTPEEARLSQVMLRTGGSAVLVADHTKVGAAGHVAYGNLGDFDVWITTDQLSAQERTRYETLTRIIAAPQANDLGH